MASTTLQVQVNQLSGGAGSDGTIRDLLGTRDGAAFTADWIQKQILAGYGWQITVGTLSAGGNISLVTGGGNGTTIDQDQPEFGVSISSQDWVLMPLFIDIWAQGDLDADAEEINIAVTADRAAATAAVAGTNNTAETPSNLLDNGDAIGGGSVAFSAATSDITDPTISDILAFKTVQVSGLDTTPNGPVHAEAELHYSAYKDGLYFIRGAGAFYGYWGGTAAVTAAARVVFLQIPLARISA